MGLRPAVCLRRWGCERHAKVIERGGWETQGRPKSWSARIVVSLQSSCILDVTKYVSCLIVDRYIHHTESARPRRVPPRTMTVPDNGMCSPNLPISIASTSAISNPGSPPRASACPSVPSDDTSSDPSDEIRSRCPYRPSGPAFGDLNVQPLKARLRMSALLGRCGSADWYARRVRGCRSGRSAKT